MSHRDYMADAVAECERGPMSESDSKRLARLRERIAACSEYCGDALPPAELIWLLDLAERTIKAEALVRIEYDRLKAELALCQLERADLETGYAEAEAERDEAEALVGELAEVLREIAPEEGQLIPFSELFVSLDNANALLATPAVQAALARRAALRGASVGADHAAGAHAAVAWLGAGLGLDGNRCSDRARRGDSAL